MACSTILMGCLVLSIEISTSGGFGGISAAGKQKRLDMDTVAEPDRSKICEAFATRKLKAIANKVGHAGAADVMTYRIVVVDIKKQRHEFNIREDVLPPELLDMIDEF